MQEVRTFAVQQSIKGGVDLVFTANTLAWDIKGAGQRQKIGVVGQNGFAVAAVEKELLPLANHAEALVIEQQDFHRQFFTFDGAQLLDIHHDRAVARYADHGVVGTGDLRADCGGQAEAHGAQAAGGDEIFRRVEVHMLRSPHLVLADVGGDDGTGGFAIGELF